MSNFGTHNLSCHVCGEDSLFELSGYSELPRVTSDCQPWGAGGRLGVCPHCGCVQKVVNKDWRGEAEKIYAQYEIYAQSGGEDQAVFDPATGQVSRRSFRLLDCTLEGIDLPEHGTWLDIGCGNGALLTALSERFPTWKLTGSELGDANRDRVEAIPNVVSFYGDGLDSIDVTFNAISMVHVLEHVDNPVVFLRDIKRLLNSDGYLLIEVPYYIDNPFDLLIADHCTHFAPRELQRVLHKAGYEVLSVSTQCVSKEISLLARISEQEGLSADPALEADEDAKVKRSLQARVDWLKGIRNDLQDFGTGGRFGIFGSSIAACFADQSSAGRAEFFVDEDTSRIGRMNLDRDIVAPQDVPSDGRVYVPLPHPLCQKIASRLNKGKDIYTCPPDLDE